MLVTVLTYRRPHYLARTLEALRTHVCEPEGLRVRVFVNAEDPETMAVLDRQAEILEEVHTSPVNLFQGPALTRLWTDPGTDWVLHVEDDFPVRRGGWLRPALSYLRDNPEVGQLRLFPWEVFSVQHRHSITREESVLGPVEVVQGERFALHVPGMHMSFCPSLMASATLARLLPLCKDDRMHEAERFAIRRFHETGMGTAQILDPPFVHEGRRTAEGGWGHGFGLHPTTTRLGVVVRRARLGLAAFLKRLLGPRWSQAIKRKVFGDPEAPADG